MDIALNPVYLPFLNDESKFLVLLGGAGSGKSYFAAQKCLIRASSGPGHRIIYVRKVAKSLRNSSFLLFKDLITQWGLDCVVKETTMDIIFQGSEILSAALDDVEKLKSLAQPTSIWIEEATEIAPKDLRQLVLRLRGVTSTYVQIILSFNPISKKHWLYDRFVTNPPPRSTLLKTTFLDNYFLDDDYRQMLMELKDEDVNFYNIYTLGEWGTAIKGLIFKYKLCDEMPEGGVTAYGLDFAYVVPTALVKVCIKENDVYIEEVVYKKKITNNDLIREMDTHEISKRDDIFADSAEPGRIEEIYRAGYNVKPANKNVGLGIDAVKRLHLHIVKTSTNIIDEIDSYKWKEDKNEIQLDAPVKLNDHAMDAIRYAIFGMTNIVRYTGGGFVPKPQ